jgi:two-component system, cell cycle sensor histidine kinase PleC
MAAQVNGNEANAVGDETRMLQARLGLMVRTLSGAVWINPCLAILWVLPFTGLFPIFGTITPWNLAVILGLQLLNSFGARLFLLGYQRDPSDPERWLMRLAAYQAATGTGWGLFAWLIWTTGNPLNNVLVTMSVSVIVWAYAFSRSMHAGVYLAGVMPTIILMIARLAYSGGEVALPLSVITAITFFLVYIYAFGARRMIEVMMQTRFDNEDLAVELRETRDDALRKRFEAEAANASKTTFLANMSHELRTPLNAILGFSDLIANETLGPVGTKRYCEYAHDINTSGSHLLSLINDILDVAKIEAGKMEISQSFIEPGPAIDEALNVVLVRATEKRQELNVKIDPEVQDLYADERAFKQIVINLLSNAVKFTPDKGHIAISLRQTADGGCELCVADNGPGIPEQQLEQIFMPFNQIDNRYSRQAGGTGLGLSLIRGLAELHGGRAWIVSKAGAGVQAHVYLPGAPRSASALRLARA